MPIWNGAVKKPPFRQKCHIDNKSDSPPLVINQIKKLPPPFLVINWSRNSRLVIKPDKEASPPPKSEVNRKIQTKHKCSGYFREQISGCVMTAAEAGSSSRTFCSYLSNLPCCREIEIRTCQNEAAVKSSSSGKTWIPLQITGKWEWTEAIHV